MKCKRCGHVTRTINAMREHYAKKHPAALKRRTTDAKTRPKKFCSECGRPL